MTENYHMVKGQSDWSTLYNKFVDDNQIVDTGWQSTGVTYLNGFGKDGQDPFEYRVINFGKTILFFIKGNASDGKGGGVSLTNNGRTAIAKFPTNLSQYNDNSTHNVEAVVGRWTTNGEAIHIRMDLAADGTLTAWPMGVTSGSFFIDSLFIVTTL